MMSAREKMRATEDGSSRVFFRQSSRVFFRLVCVQVRHAAMCAGAAIAKGKFLSKTSLIYSNS